MGYRWLILLSLLMVSACGGNMTTQETYYLRVPGAENNAYLKIIVVADSNLTEAELRQGWYPAEAVDELFGDISSEGSAKTLETRNTIREQYDRAIVKATRDYLDAAAKPGTSAEELRERLTVLSRVRLTARDNIENLKIADVIEYNPAANLIHRRSGQKLVFVLSSDPTDVINEIQGFAASNDTRALISRLTGVITAKERAAIAGSQVVDDVGAQQDGLISEQAKVTEAAFLQGRTRAEAELKRVQNAIFAAKMRLAKAQENEGSARKALAELRAELVAQQEQLAVLRREETSLNGRLSDLRQDRESIQDDVRQRRQVQEAAETEYDRRRDEYKNAVSALEDEQKKLETLNEEARSTEDELQAARERLAELEASGEAEEDKEAAQRAVDLAQQRLDQARIRIEREKETILLILESKRQLVEQVENDKNLARDRRLEADQAVKAGEARLVDIEGELTKTERGLRTKRAEIVKAAATEAELDTKYQAREQGLEDAEEAEKQEFEQASDQLSNVSAELGGAQLSLKGHDTVSKSFAIGQIKALIALVRGTLKEESQ